MKNCHTSHVLCFSRPFIMKIRSKKSQQSIETLRRLIIQINHLLFLWEKCLRYYCKRVLKSSPCYDSVSRKWSWDCGPFPKTHHCKLYQSERKFYRKQAKTRKTFKYLSVPVLSLVQTERNELFQMQNCCLIRTPNEILFYLLDFVRIGTKNDPDLFIRVRLYKLWLGFLLTRVQTIFWTWETTVRIKLIFFCNFVYKKNS